MLARFRERAGGYDESNSFPNEDLQELRESGYLRAFVPAEMGGLGWSLEQTCRAQRRLGAHAPATALAVNMHLIWAGVGRLLHAVGDDTADGVLRDIANGEVYALGISEPGNDLALLDSVVEAVPDGEGGYTYTGTKIFTSLSPVWTRLGIFGRDDSGAEPRLMHGVVLRDDAGVEILEDWNTVGMRATQSHTTRLNSVHIPAERILAAVPVGPNAHPLMFGIFSNFLLLLSSVYLGISDRAIELSVEAANARTRRSAAGATLAADPVVRDEVARMAMRQEVSATLVSATAHGIDALAASGSLEGAPMWFPKLQLSKHEATRTARENVEAALGIVGGAAMRRDHELARLYRDVAAGIFHPSQDRSVREAFAAGLFPPSSDDASAEGADSSR